MIASLMGDITEAIAHLSIDGVTVKDVPQIAASWVSLSNVLYPNPDEFVTNFQLQYRSLPRGADAKVDIQYTLNYRFLGTQIGDMGNLGKAYSAAIDKILLVIAAMMETTSPYDGRVDMTLGAVSIGARVDPAGNGYHGADIALNIMEMQNA